MILGYDLGNEPYWHDLMHFRDGSQTLGERFPPSQDGWRDYQRTLHVAEGDFTSTFPGLKGKLPVPEDPRLRQSFENINSIYGTWIGWLIEAIRQVDKTHPISVGYNTIFDCLPANAPLDFVAHHTYELPEGFEHVRNNITTMDRLHAIWPDRPIMLGEFGYSDGNQINGQYLDAHVAAVGEMAHYLYALTHDYEGVMKWTLWDYHPAFQWRFQSWNRQKSEAIQVREQRFGMYYPDGTWQGRPKPIVYATRFLRDYLESGATGGTLEIRPAATMIGAGYVYRNRGVLFVGDTRYQSAELSFTSPRAVNVMLAGNTKQLKIMATGDVTVSIDPTALGVALDAANAKVRSARGTVQREGKRLKIELLAGETVIIE